MAKIRTKSPAQEEVTRIVELLDNSLEASTLGGRDFLDKTRQYLLDRFVTLAPGHPVSLPSGKSYLVSLVKASFEQALDWAERGDLLAWQPTPQNPYPLTEIISQFKGGSWDKREYRWPAGAAAHAKRVEGFLVNGFARAMPMTTFQAQHQLAGNKRSDHKEFEAQARLTQFCQIDDDLFKAATKIRHFSQAQGMITLGINEKLDWVKWYSAGALDPDTPVAVCLPGRTKLMPWVQAWAEDFQDAAEMFKRLDPTQYDVDDLRQAYLRKVLPKVRSWKEARERLDTTPGGWHLTSSNEPSRLLWQELLVDNPGWLDDVCLEPKSRLLQTAPGGSGVWDCVLEGWSRFSSEQNMSSQRGAVKLPCRATIECLVTKVPPTVDHGGHLFVPRRQAHDILADTFDITFDKAPHTWVGQPNEDQASLASSLLARLLIGQGRGNASDRGAAAQQAALLYKAWQRAPESVSASTVSVLWCLREYLSQVDAKADDVDVSELTSDTALPPPRAGTMEWAPLVIEQIRRDHPTANVMTSVLGRARLTALSSDRPASGAPAPLRHL